jgi:DNA-binding SARP family transcriptional activator/basic membrane lipoprotein Med (substrate-binding protein (PBP1-ABC) superfamily)
VTSSRGIEFRVLGPLEVRVDGEPVTLGGAKQRAALAALLLSANEVISVERLIDEVWGDQAPPSASHSLEAYVSRIRQLLNGYGPTLTRRGAGYRLDLGDAVLDAKTFVHSLEEASNAFDAGGVDRAAGVVADALELWHGPALADVQLASAGRAEAERLEELRLRAYELHFECELERGRHDGVVGELQLLVSQNPYRERFVAQLMLALYRAGRHAEALEIYEHTRRRLDADLGLLPSPELQQLSGQIVRQDPLLRRPTSTPTGFTRPSTAKDRTRRAAALVVTGVVASALLLAASGGAAVPERVSPTAKRLALVLPGSADRLEDVNLGDLRPLGLAADRLATAALSGEILYGLESQTAFVDPKAPESDVDAVAARIRNGGVGLVVALGDGPAARALAGIVRRMPDTRFVFIDASVSELSLEGVPNAAAIRFSDEDALYLGGYLAGLVPTMDGSKRRVDAVSVVAGEPTPDTARLIAGFKRGLRASRPGVSVRVDYSRELLDVTACEHLANRQIDAGSDVVLALAGHCSLGALVVARTRGVWGAGAEEDGINLTDHVLAATQKEWTTATLLAIERLKKGTLAMGRDTVLGFEDDYMVKMWWSNWAPEDAQSTVIDRCSEMRSRRHQDL